MKTTLCLLFTAVASYAFASEVIVYDEAIAFAQERSRTTIPTDKAMYCLGPERLDEFHIEEGAEELRIARNAKVFDAQEANSLGELIKRISLIQNASYEINVYRGQTKNLSIRITANAEDLDHSQLELNVGDLVVVERSKQK